MASRSKRQPAPKTKAKRNPALERPAPPVPRRASSGWTRWGLFIVIATTIAGGAILLYRDHQKRNPAHPGDAGSTPVTFVPIQPRADYAGSATCRQCHQNEFDRWSQSHHGLAERAVQPEIDKPAFDPPRTFHHGTQTSEVRIDGGKDQVVAVDLSGKMQPQTVQRVIGVSPLEQFLVDAGHGRMQTLEASYDPIHRNWFNVYGNEDRQPGEWGHWTGRGMTWSLSVCAACHNTGLHKNYDAAADSYQTTMSEPSVSCEACHGPMKPHVQWQQKFNSSGKKDAAVKDPTVTHPSRDQIIETCGSCHSSRGELTGDFLPGQSYFDHYELEGVSETEVFIIATGRSTKKITNTRHSSAARCTRLACA